MYEIVLRIVFEQSNYRFNFVFKPIKHWNAFSTISYVKDYLGIYIKENVLKHNAGLPTLFLMPTTISHVKRVKFKACFFPDKMLSVNGSKKLKFSESFFIPFTRHHFFVSSSHFPLLYSSFVWNLLSFYLNDFRPKNGKAKRHSLNGFQIMPAPKQIFVATGSSLQLSLV